MLRAALRRFAADPKDPLLRTHKLSGDLDGYWAFSVDDDLRVLFRWQGDVAFLVNWAPTTRSTEEAAPRARPGRPGG